MRRHLSELFGGPSGQILVVLIAVGLALRVAASLAIWPIGLGIDDSAPYASAAAHNVLSDVQAPAGYPALLAALGALTRQVAAVAIIQHLLGIIAAIVLYAAVRRATGRGWLAIVPAAVVLLDSDQIYLEHSVMAEGVLAIVLASAFYAAVRVLERPRATGWAVLAGMLIGAAGVIRSAATALPLALIVAILLTEHPLRRRVSTAVTTLAATAAVLLAYAAVNYSHSHEFTVGPDPGWHLYGMVASYADCDDFKPPSGTSALCQRTASDAKQGLNFYLYDPRSPAWQRFGYFKQDRAVGAFATSVVWHEPDQYLRNVALNLLGYFVPGSYPSSYGDPLGGQGLSPPLDWTHRNPDAGRLSRVMTEFFAPFAQHVDGGWLRLLHAWQRVFRFGATLLLISTLLTLAGLVVPGRRALLVLFGASGLCLLIVPSVIGEYSGRYTVPMAAPMLTSAAIAADALWRRAATHLSANSHLGDERPPSMDDLVRPI
jgi:Dolichyl-phosphate-mannose-protein mannosyltransferase